MFYGGIRLQKEIFYLKKWKVKKRLLYGRDPHRGSWRIDRIVGWDLGQCCMDNRMTSCSNSGHTKFSVLKLQNKKKTLQLFSKFFLYMKLGKLLLLLSHFIYPIWKVKHFKITSFIILSVL